MTLRYLTAANQPSFPFLHSGLIMNNVDAMLFCEQKWVQSISEGASYVYTPVL